MRKTLGEDVGADRDIPPPEAESLRNGKARRSSCSRRNA